MRIKRPLCFVCLIFAIFIFAIQLVNPPPTIVSEEGEGKTVIVMGQVTKKEYKKEKLIITLKNIQFLEFSQSDIMNHSETKQITTK